MYAASPGTFTDQIAGSASAEVAVRSSVPTLTVTLTPLTDPVSPAMIKPAAFSSMLIVPPTAMTFTFSTSAPAGTTITVNMAVATA